MMTKVDSATFTIDGENRIGLQLPPVVVPGAPLTIRITPPPDAAGRVGLVTTVTGIVSPDGTDWSAAAGPMPGWSVTFFGSGIIELTHVGEEGDDGADAAFVLTSADGPVDVLVELISMVPPTTPAEWVAAKDELRGLLGGLTDPAAP